jgi:hypothetical protein
MRKMTILLLSLVFSASSASARDGETRLYASLNGNSETTPNATYGTGIFSAHLNPASGQLCYKLTSQNLALLTTAVIGFGNLGVGGPTMVTLLPDSFKETCIAIDLAVAASIAAKSHDYYVEIRTQTYPKGEIRGQLMK